MEFFILEVVLFSSVRRGMYFKMLLALYGAGALLNFRINLIFFIKVLKIMLILK